MRPPSHLLAPRKGPAAATARRASRAQERGGALVSEHRLRNGLTVLVAERDADPVVAALLLYRVGSRNESEREAGLAHFLEHMMFKGSARFGKGEVDRVTTILGGQNNAHTNYDHTGYWFELAADRWEVALEIEADRMRGLLLDADEYDAERDVVLEELRSYDDDPWSVLSHRVAALACPRHPYGRPIIGHEDSLRAMSPDDMRDFHGRFYHPANATLVLCGDVTSSRAVSAARKHFGKISAGSDLAQADGWRPEIVEPYGEQRLVMTWDDSARRLCVAWPTTTVGTPEDYALDLAMTVLASGRTSRLQDRLIHRDRLAVYVSASNDVRVEGGFFWLFVECPGDVDPRRVEAVIDEELGRLASEAPSAAELKRAREVLVASEAYDSETVTDIAEELGEFAVDAHWSLALDGGERHRLVKPSAVRDVVRRYLRPERRALGWCHPESEQPRGDR